MGFIIFLAREVRVCCQRTKDATCGAGGGAVQAPCSVENHESVLYEYT